MPGEERLRGHGVSHCASCDAPLLRDKVAGVIGGGDSALPGGADAGRARLAGADRAAARGRADRAGDLPRRVAEHPKIEVRHGVVVEEILGDTKVDRRAHGAAGDRRSPLDAVFVVRRPGAEHARRSPACSSLDATGGSRPTPRCAPSLPGLFAAGIVRRVAGRAAASAGDGAAAANAAPRSRRRQLEQ